MAWYQDLFAREDPFRNYGESEASRAQVDFITEKTEIQPGDRVLDLCCGQGRHLLDLMRRGFDVVGVDLSDYMLGECRKTAAEAGLQPQLVRSDMREIAFENEFDAAFNVFTSFGYLESEDEDQKSLDALARALKPGGRFLVDLLNRDGLMTRFKAKDWVENDRGDLTICDRSFDALTGRIDTREVTAYADGTRAEVRHFIRLYTYNELEKMLGKAGMEVTAAWGGFDSSPFAHDSRRMIVVAHKSH